MHTFIKITAIVLIVIGLLVVVTGIGMGAAGLVGGGMMRGASFRSMPMRAAMPGFGFGGFLALIPGAVLTGLGQALYLLNELVRKTLQKASTTALPPAQS